MLEPLDFIARLAALVPPPRMHLTHFHGGFAPHSKLRAAVTPAGRGPGGPKPRASAADPGKPPTPRQVAMNWARRLQRVFGIEIDSCARCGGKLEIIASIGEPEVIAKIVAHLERVAPQPYQREVPLGAVRPPDLSGEAGRRQARARQMARLAGKPGEERRLKVAIRPANGSRRS